MHDVSEPALSASSYTSVAQEFNEPPPPELAIDEQAERIVATAAVDGWLAVVALDGADSEDAPIVADVLVAPRAVDRAMSVGFARPAASGSTVAVLCSSPPELVAGGRFEPAADCVVRVLGGATSDR